MSRGIIIINVLYRSQATPHSITTTVVRLGHSMDVSIIGLAYFSRAQLDVKFSGGAETMLK